MGGAERLLADMLPLLRGNGHVVELLLFDGTRTPLYESLEQQGIPVHALGRGFRQMWNPLHILRLRKFLQADRFDIVHTHNTPCQLLVALAAGKNTPALITTEHNTTNRRRDWSWYQGIDRRMYGRYRHIVCVSEKTRNNLVDRLGFRPDTEMISVIANGIDLDRFAGPASESLRGENERDQRIIVMVAAFRPQKDQPTLIRAMRHLPERYRLWLVGDGPKKASCEQLTAELSLQDRVRFWGNRTDIPELLFSADVAVLSSYYEGQALSCIEGMASGRPFVAGEVDGLQEVVGGAGLLFPCGDDRKLAEMIRTVCEDRELYDAVAGRCKARAAAFDIGKTVSAYEELYRSVTGK